MTDLFNLRKYFYVLVSILLFASFGNKADAQTWTIGGNITLKTANKYAYTRLEVDGGYEFNDKWAVGLKTGFETGSDTGSFILGGNGRFTPWHNDVLYIDIKAVADLLVYDVVSLNTGIVPSLRFRVAPRWEVYSDFGFIGLRGQLGYGLSPVAVITALNAGLGVTFRF